MKNIAKKTDIPPVKKNNYMSIFLYFLRKIDHMDFLCIMIEENKKF